MLNCCKLYILLFFVFVVGLLQAQSDNSQLLSDTTLFSTQSTLISNTQFTTLNPQLETEKTTSLQEDSIRLAKQMRREQRALDQANFKPDPNKSLWLGLTFPGAGQIYNRKYWKLPIIYGGAMGVAYAVSYYGGHYNDYMKGYRDYLDSDPNTNYHLELIPQGYPESSAGNYVKNRVNSYRRYRDIFIVVGVAVYALSVIDAYVDAQLADFDISTDLSMKVRPKLDIEQHTGKPTAGCQMQIYF
ncbi:MAG: hypothetical protein IKY67_00905 [Paludibacteraceae bacterium]|nr:hypothetical protein [Paludibacteraceae bacterium]